MAARSYPPPSPRKLTRAEYYRMEEAGILHPEERVELIEGLVVRMSPIGPEHSSVVRRLTELLIVHLGQRALVSSQQPYVADDHSEPEPDIAVVPRATYRTRHPDRAFLVIEVAESSLQYDRETKGPLYAASRVDEYWIVDVVGHAIEVHTDPANGRYGSIRRVTTEARLSPAAFPDVVVDVAALFA